MGTDVVTGDPIAAQLVAIQQKHAQQLRQLEAAQRQFQQERHQLYGLESELASLVEALHGKLAASQATATPAPPLDGLSLFDAVLGGQAYQGALDAYVAGVNRANAKSPVTLILNPAARSFGEMIGHPRLVVEALRQVGITPQLQLTTLEVGARTLAKQAVDQGAQLVIALGGDGTIEEVAAALMDSRCILGILPLGTMNNVARSLGIPLDLPSACRLLAMGTVRHIDIGRVVTPDQAIEGCFLEAAGVGLSALAVPMGEDAEKGRWSGVFNRLGDFLAANLADVTVTADDGTTLSARTHVVTVANTPLFGNNMLLAPEAKIDDGLLDVAIYEAMELVDLARYFFNISAGGRTQEPRVHFRQTRLVRIQSTAPLAANADLDVLPPQTSWTIEIVPHALAVIVGNGPALTTPVTAAPPAPPLAGL